MRYIRPQYPYNVLFTLVIAFFLLFVTQYLYKRVNTDKRVSSFQKTFLEKEKLTEDVLQNVIDQLKDKGLENLLSDEEWVASTDALFEKSGHVVFFYDTDSLIYLSNNVLPVNNNNLPRYNFGIEYIENGWYLLKKRKFEELDVWIAFLIKESYNYHNRYLKNQFNSSFQLTNNVEISINSAVGEMIFFNNGDYAMSLIIDDAVPISRGKMVYIVLLTLINIFIIFLVVYLFYYYLIIQKDKWNSLFRITLFFIALTGIRALLFYLKIPEIFYESVLFSPRYYATSKYLPSLGDLFLHVIFLNVFLNFTYNTLKTTQLANRSAKSSVVLTLILILSLYAFFALLIIDSIYGLVINSHLTLSVYFIFETNFYNILGFFIVGLLFLSAYFVKSILFLIYNSIQISSGNLKVYLIAVFTIIIIVFLAIAPLPYPFLWLFIYLTLPLFYYLKKRSSSPNKLSVVFVLFFVYGIIGTAALNEFNNEKEVERRKNLALRISSEQDPVAEFQFMEQQEELFSDQYLDSILYYDPFNDKVILEYIENEYFKELSLRYDIQVTSCNPSEILLLKPFDDQVNCHDYFEYYISNFGKPTMSDRFIYLDNNTGRNSYITKLSVGDTLMGNFPRNLYIEFESKFIPRELGFPELLIDQEQMNYFQNLGEYSYAIYKEGSLTHKYGTHLYNLEASSYQINDTLYFQYQQIDQFSHLFYKRDNETLVVVSKPRDTFLEMIAPFSYLFGTFLILALIFYLPNISKFNFIKIHLNFRSRLQVLMIAIVLISVLSIGGISAVFIYNIYDNKNVDFISEKAHSVLIELENNLSNEPYLTTSMREYLNGLLLRLSNAFFSDINLFDPDGNLLASSRMRVYEEGLIASRMHPQALYQLDDQSKSFYLHNEKIGELNYLSAYVPLRNLDNKVIAYINLPYFAKQRELRNEISYFLVAFVNIYLILLLVTILIAYFISNHVTKPLQIIRDNLSRLSITKSNKKIDWSRKDEIGQLVTEYNRMIDELSLSAELLAKSERESAWREMAKQVAHEIKNPLTPMRLNVQYLERAWKSKEKNWDERLEKFTRNMVEQIDDLAVIASEFSDFAKMPQNKDSEIIDLKRFIQQIPEQYRGYDNLDFVIKTPEKNGSLNIRGDKNHLARVFNNLIKNAIQSYDRKSERKIEIRYDHEENYARVEIIDFGKGIPEQEQKNVFQPYFTTKSSGTGLGLAMVKSILTSMNASIFFTSEPNKGTRFVIRIPRHNSNE